MIEFKEAIVAAREYAKELFGDQPTRVEEIDAELHNSYAVWSITLGFYEYAAGTRFTKPRPEFYKRFLVRKDTGEVVAMMMREVSMA
jgi:hypothetical protein